MLQLLQRDIYAGLWQSLEQPSNNIERFHMPTPLRPPPQPSSSLLLPSPSSNTPCSTSNRRCYLASIAALPHPAQLLALRDGIALKPRDRSPAPAQREHRHMRSSARLDNALRLRPIDASVLAGSCAGASCTLQLLLRQGVNREVRRVCEHFGWPLLSLLRSSYGPWRLDDLQEGRLEEVPPQLLQQQLRDLRLNAAARDAT
jgi:16S rRNA U516 pseudouridylate synthase RsuA-like enzyme